MPTTKGHTRLRASGFAALRTPLLAFAEATALSDGLRAPAVVGDADALPAAVEHDRALVRTRIRSALARAEVREAIVVASPDLIDAADRAAGRPDSRVDRATFRYLTRMATRCTPFGLFAGTSTVPIGDVTGLTLAPRAGYRRHTRLDMEFMCGLVDAVTSEADVRAETTYHPNSSCYEVAGNVRYVYSRWDGEQRSHHLMAVTATRDLRLVLASAADGATPDELAASLRHAGLDGEQAARYVDSLIDAQLLVPDLAPAVTGEDPVGQLVGALVDVVPAKKVGERLDALGHELSAMDCKGVGVPLERHRCVAEQAAALPHRALPGRLLQVDLVKPAAGWLGRGVVEELARAVRVLHRMARTPVDDPLERFRQRFEQRYEGRAVGLLEALDGEHGIGFGSSPAAPPLLRGMTFPPVAPVEETFGARERFLLARLGETLRHGETELALTRADLDALASDDPPPLPAALAVTATLVASSAEAVNRGRFRLVVNGAGGPSGARLLGRFCHADPQLRDWVQQHLRAEEDQHPDAVFAEVAHLPQGRMGNILLRPTLRAYEIPYLGRSGAPPERQLPVDDLLVAVRDGKLVLLSRRLGRRVIPRLTSAHNYSQRSQPVYRFLAALQSDQTAGGLAWRWGPLASSPFLPRVRYGRLVLARARWRVDRDELRRLGAAGEGAPLLTEITRWRRERDLPRHVVLADHDNTLLVDLGNIVAVESFVQLVRTRDEAVLQEVLPGGDELCCTSPEGTFAHELVVPFTADQPTRQRDSVISASSAVATSSIRRSFPSGSEWLYAKPYCGETTADRLLRDVVAPLREDVLGSGSADNWFFVRYADPDPHLRIRFHGDPAQLAGVRMEVEHAAAGALDDDLMWRLTFDTYEREVERYGGPAGMPIAEQIFGVDSDAVVGILRLLERGEAGERERWQLALRGTDMLLDDFGLDPAGKLRLMRRARDGFAAEHRMDGRLRGQIGKRYRQQRATVDALLDRSQDADSPLEPGLAILRERSERLAPLVERLRAAELTDPIERLAPSFVHMYLNRLLRSRHRRQELVLYTYLANTYQTQGNRKRKGKGGPS